MSTVRYALLEDVLRQYDLDISESDLGNEIQDSAQVITRFNAHTTAAESEFESVTDNAFRPIRVGIPDSPATYKYHKAKGGNRNSPRGNPAKVFLDHMHIVPFSSADGDRIEVRTGRDTWRDITGDEGSKWRADYRKGVIEILYGAYGGSIGLRTDYVYEGNDDSVRVCYQYGGTGGDERSGGYTTLDSTLNDSDTGNQSVGDVSRLPFGTNIFLLGNSEYVEATNDGSTFNILKRGERNTDATSHSSGDGVHYCPLDVREGIAAKAAMEILRQEDTLDILIESGDQLEVNARISELKKRWQNVTMKYNNAMGYS